MGTRGICENMGLNSIHLKKSLLQQGISLHNAKSIHLAIVNEPYLKYILQGEKTIESRFTKNCVSPYKKVFPNDIVLMKRAGQAINSYFVASGAMFFENTPEVFRNLKKNYSKQICADEDFWKVRENKKYITLIQIKDVIKTREAIAVEKKDKRGWVTIKNNRYKKVYLISGKIGSGKTWLSNKISDLLKLDRCSFSDYVKWKCNQLGMPTNRENLNLVGEKAVGDWLTEFVYYLFNCTIEKKSDILIIDGLRHIEILDEIAKYCDEIEIIYIDSDIVTITENLMERNTLEEDNRFYSAERQLLTIKEKANLIIKSSNEVDAVLEYMNGYSRQISLFD